MSHETIMKIIITAFMLGVLLTLNAADTTKINLRYNYMTGEHHYKQQSDVMKYNHMENTWSYEPQRSELKYNPYTNSWEYVNEHN